MKLKLEDRWKHRSAPKRRALSAPISTSTPTPTPAPAVEAILTPLERARVDRWVASRIIDWPPESCLHCRKPIIVGQLWTIVSNGDCTAQFHEPCHAEWLEVQEAPARRAMGLRLARSIHET